METWSHCKKWGVMITLSTYNNTRGENAKGALITSQALVTPLECCRNAHIGVECYCSTLSELHFATLSFGEPVYKPVILSFPNKTYLSLVVKDNCSVALV